MEKYPELVPFEKRKAGPRPPMPPAKEGLLTMGPGLYDYLISIGREATVTHVEEGWDRTFKTKEEAYEFLLPLSRHPEEVILEKFKENVDKYLTEVEDGYYFFLPTVSDVTVFKTRV